VRDGHEALSFIYFLGCALLVASGLLARRLPLGQTLKMALAWIGIFAAAFLAFALRDDFRALGSRLLAEIRGGETQQVAGGTVRIRQSDDGHFWVDAELNGHAERFLVDSGATVTTVNRGTARRAGIEPTGHFGAVVVTANGTTVEQRAIAGTLKLGPIERRDFAIHISNEEEDANVIGMNFLSSLSAWGVEGQTLVLHP
jgi:aspartyl protease family protein